MHWCCFSSFLSCFPLPLYFQSQIPEIYYSSIKPTVMVSSCKSHLRGFWLEIWKTFHQQAAQHWNWHVEWWRSLQPWRLPGLCKKSPSWWDAALVMLRLWAAGWVFQAGFLCFCDSVKTFCDTGKRHGITSTWCSFITFPIHQTERTAEYLAWFVAQAVFSLCSLIREN